MSAQQQVRGTEANADKNRPRGTNFYRKCQKTGVYEAQFMNFGGEGQQHLARCRIWRGFTHREDSGNMQSSFQRRIRSKLSLYNMEVSLEHSTRAAGGSACPGKIELLRGLEVFKAWQCLGERSVSLAAKLFCSEFQKGERFSAELIFAL